MASSKEGTGVRVRLRFPKDADGLMEYLDRLDPSTLSTTVYQLAYLGWLFKKDMLRNGGSSSTQAPVTLQRPAADPAEAGVAPVPATSVVNSDTDEAELNSFGRMFGETYKLAAH